MTERQMADLLAALRSLTVTEPIGGSDETICVYCDGESAYERSPEGPWFRFWFYHAPDCPWVAAKALVEQLND